MSTSTQSNTRTVNVLSQSQADLVARRLFRAHQQQSYAATVTGPGEYRLWAEIDENERIAWRGMASQMFLCRAAAERTEAVLIIDDISEAAIEREENGEPV